jgi:hypothetical protein
MLIPAPSTVKAILKAVGLGSHAPLLGSRLLAIHLTLSGHLLIHLLLVVLLGLKIRNQKSDCQILVPEAF